ncbi:MAG: twin-arginine translocation signal domain-containing protein [Opitutaceae bacterium]|mgnify:CR=1 FL=1|jgi:hypothetical protein|nr:twin-arginine translocation signal domain-containing protein [Opitutaceae bacterium]
MTTPRRSFLKQSSLAATAVAVAPGLLHGQGAEGTGEKGSIMEQLTAINDALIEDLLPQQVELPGERWDGGMADRYEIININSTLALAGRLGNSYSSPSSEYYLSPRLEVPMERAMACVLRVQHEDGTTDLHTTNFHSTPDVAFLVNYISPIFVNLRQLDRPGLAGVIENMEQFLRNGGRALAVGGIHTPNHRWVVGSALARVHALFPSQAYVDRIDDWLGEGIDMDPDGQFTERSVSIYSPICDNMFLTMGRLLQRDELLDIARKNLDMTLYYIQPGGEVLTDASGRQDNARIGYVANYYYAYRYFALKDNNPVYAAVCRLIEDEMPERITRYISELLEDPTLREALPVASKIPDDYAKRFAHSGVFRIRHGDADLSVIEENPTFMSFMKGNAVLQSIRLAAAFFGSRGMFISEGAEFSGRTVTLTKSHTHGYYQPFPEDERIADGEWEKMPRDKRAMSELQTLNYRVEVTEAGGKVSIDIQIEGTPHVPVSMEMSFRSGGELEGVVADKNLDDAYFLESGKGQYKSPDGDVITFGPGISEHKWSEIRGMLPKQNGDSVYLTGFTPFRHTLQLG